MNTIVKVEAITIEYKRMAEDPDETKPDERLASP